MAFKPFGDRIAVEAFESEEKTAGGIIIPDSAKDKPMKGKIVGVGQGASNEAGNIIPMKLKVGDVVVYGKWAGTEIEVDGKKLMIMKETDVMGTL